MQAPWRANVYARGRLAYMLMRVAETHVLAGDPRRAAPLLTESVEQARFLPEHGSDATVTLSKAYLFLGEVAVATAKDPCPSYRLMAGMLAKLPDGDPSNHFEAETASLRDGALDRLKACKS